MILIFVLKAWEYYLVEYTFFKFIKKLSIQQTW